MSQEFDAVGKALFDMGPGDWALLAGVPGPPPWRRVEAELTTVTAASDRILRLDEPRGGADFWMLVLEFATYRELAILRRMRKYVALLSDRYECPASAALILFKDDADARRLTGEWREADPLTGQETVFRYGVVRLWEVPTERLLTGGLATLALAPVGTVDRDDVEATVERMRLRVDAELTREERGDFWARVDVVMGLRYTQDEVARWLRGVSEVMQESVTYQAIREEGIPIGELREACLSVLDMGTDKFGEPDEAARQAITAIHDLNRLRRMRRRVLRAGSWAELLAEPE